MHEKLMKLRTAQTEPQLTGFSIESVYVKIHALKCYFPNVYV